MGAGGAVSYLSGVFRRNIAAIEGVKHPNYPDEYGYIAHRLMTAKHSEGRIETIVLNKDDLPELKRIDNHVAITYVLVTFTAPAFFGLAAPFAETWGMLEKIVIAIAVAFLFYILFLVILRWRKLFSRVKGERISVSIPAKRYMKLMREGWAKETLKFTAFGILDGIADLSGSAEIKLISFGADIGSEVLNRSLEK